MIGGWFLHAKTTGYGAGITKYRYILE